MKKTSHNAYSQAGVDTEREETGLDKLTKRIRKTWPITKGKGSVKLDIGFFANVIDVGGIGLAISTDGVGTKVIIAQMMARYDTVGIDCVAMNVNDLICVGAQPLSMVDYIALQDPSPKLLDDISKGLCDGAEMAGISISGGEIAQLREIVKGYKEGLGFDLAGTAIGTVDLDKIIIGQDIQEGDVVVGIESNGIHSNGLTLARHVFFDQKNYDVETYFPEFTASLGEELLKPTHIYVKEVLQILNAGIHAKALIHITSDGFLNLTRVASKVGYVIEELPPTPSIFSLIQKFGNVSDEEMFRVYNMGIGFCVVVPADEVNLVIEIVRSHKKQAYKIGHVIADKTRRVFIKPRGLVGKDGRFFKA